MKFWRKWPVAFVVLVSACVGGGPQVYLSPVATVEAEAGEGYKLGDKEVVINVTGSGGSHVFVALHANETASIAAGKAVGGKMVRIVNNGQRLISFTYKGQSHTIDPNRIFTSAGIKKTLTGKHSAEVYALVDGLAKVILKHLRGSLVVALHNNTNNRDLTIGSFLPEGNRSGEASDAHVGKDKDPDNFFFVTESDRFGKLKSADWNVALQSPGAKDDGSLSVYAAQNGIPYANVEAETGNTSEQIRMLKFLLSM